VHYGSLQQHVIGLYAIMLSKTLTNRLNSSLITTADMIHNHHKAYKVQLVIADTYMIITQIFQNSLSGFQHVQRPREHIRNCSTWKKVWFFQTRDYVIHLHSEHVIVCYVKLCFRCISWTISLYT